MSVNTHIHFDKSGRSKSRRRPKHKQSGETGLQLSVQSSGTTKIHLSVTNYHLDDDELRRRYHKGKSRAMVSLLEHDPGRNQDAFNSFPIEFTGCVPGATEYFLKFYGPTSLVRPDIAADNASLVPGVIHDYFHYALEHALLFEAIIVVSEAVKTMDMGKPPPQVMYHHSRVLKQLRQTLLSGQGAASDYVLFAITAMLAIDYLFNDMNAFEIHLKGLRALVAIRGGVDELGWPLILKPGILTLEGLWAYKSSLEQPPDAGTSTNATTTPEADAKEILEYPRHPFPSYLSAMLAKLPKGLSELALKCKLSFAVMQLLKGIAEWTCEIDYQLPYEPELDHVPSSIDVRVVEKCKRLLVYADLNEVEKLTCAASMAYALTSGNPRHNTNPVFGFYRQQLAEEAKQLMQLEFRKPEEIACLQWAALLLATSIDEPALGSSHPRIRFLDTVLEKHERARNWKLFRENASQFFWDDDSESKWFASWEAAMRRRLNVNFKQETW